MLVPGILLALIGVYRVGFPPAKGVESRLSELPAELLGLSGVNIPVEQAILDDLESDDILIRRYIRPDGVPVWVVLIYFVNTRRGGHDPELCYRSQGYRTEGLPGNTIQSETSGVHTEEFLARKAGRNERVATFWYAPGGRIVSDVGNYRRLLFLQGLRQNRTYGAFVRISTLETDQAGLAADWNARFVAEVARCLPALIRDHGNGF
jgi:EpsI family protein